MSYSIKEHNMIKCHTEPFLEIPVSKRRSQELHTSKTVRHIKQWRTYLKKLSPANIENRSEEVVETYLMFEHRWLGNNDLCHYSCDSANSKC